MKIIILFSAIALMIFSCIKSTRGEITTGANVFFLILIIFMAAMAFWGVQLTGDSQHVGL